LVQVVANPVQRGDGVRLFVRGVTRPSAQARK
jgi:hypothetical protein